MLEKLHLKNVGPAPELEMEFAPRLNIITGDNGLGKSFILDVAWFALTGNWLEESNYRMRNGAMVRPFINSKHEIGYNYLFLPEVNVEVTAEFNQRDQKWYRRIKPDHMLKSPTGCLVIQAFSDGEFGIYDALDEPLGFTTSEVWDELSFDESSGRSKPEKIVLSNGLIRDLFYWQLENGEAFKQFTLALQILSPNENEKLVMGKPVKGIGKDVRDIPTLKMPYGQEVPITQLSSGIKRIITISYMLVWTWQQHLRKTSNISLAPFRKIVLLIDELENHLHPQWQRKILESILSVVKEIMKDDVEIQIIATTHSPLVMASLEPLFDPKQDAWFDFNLVKGEVTLEKMQWYKRGGAEEWLTSEAFDLDSTGSIENARVKNLAAKALNNPKLSKKKFLELDSELRNVLSEMDEFWIRWRFIGEKKGYL